LKSVVGLLPSSFGLRAGANLFSGRKDRGAVVVSNAKRKGRVKHPRASGGEGIGKIKPQRTGGQKRFNEGVKTAESGKREADPKKAPVKKRRKGGLCTKKGHAGLARRTQQGQKNGGESLNSVGVGGRRCAGGNDWGTEKGKLGGEQLT